MRAVGLHVIFRPMLLLMPFRHRVPAIARSRSAFVCFWVTAFSFFDFGRASRNENICGPPQLLHVDCFWLPGCPAMWLPLTLQSHLSQRHAKAGEPANAGNGSEGVCCVFIVICSPSPDPRRSGPLLGGPFSVGGRGRESIPVSTRRCPHHIEAREVGFHRRNSNG